MTQTTSTASTPPATPPSDTVSLTIDGERASAPRGTLLVEAAKLVGIEIPIFCYHPKLKPVGACRMCLVQIEKMPRLQTACTTPVAADMVVTTRSAEVIGAQNGVIEMLLENHPLDCPICDKGGECPLQNNAFSFGLGSSRFTEEKRHLEKALPLGERIVLDRERCIMCYRCVRFHQEISGDEALAAINRGPLTMIGTLPGEDYDSIFSGNTIELCPVGALTSRQYRFKARPWDLVRTPSVCHGCAVGCNIEVHSRMENVLRLVNRENPLVDGGWLCDVGRFDTLPAPPEQRATRPLAQDASGALRETTWQHALQVSADLLRTSPRLLLSPTASNEAFWLSASRVVEPAAHRPQAMAAVWPALGGDWPVRGAIANLPQCKRIVLVGLDAWFQLPVIALWIRRAVTSGAQLVVIGPENGLFRDTAAWLRVPPEKIDDKVRALAEAIMGNPSNGDAETSVAARVLQSGGAGPAALLVHPGLVDTDPQRRAGFEGLARALQADGSRGLLGAPALATNGRGARELAPGIAAADPSAVVRGATALLLLGDERWDHLPAAGATRFIVASSRRVWDDPRIAVVLPVAHPYERQGSITNLEGRVQVQEGGASPMPLARSDWGVVASLVRALGGECPEDLTAIRSDIRAQVSNWPDLDAQEALVARV